MCGIVGYTGGQNAIIPVVEGLSRLEYRGYDSAGVSIRDKDHLKIYKKEGKLEALKNILEKEKPYSNVAIGHTRWATHGKVNDTNAHPHHNEIFSIVHNGIIENAYELKGALVKEGLTFKSETDTEVFLVLLTKNFKALGELIPAVAKTFEMLKGNSAFVIMKHDSSDVVAIKNAAPLVCGENTKNGTELFVSSDPYALMGYVEKIYFPENGVICYLNRAKGKIEFFELDGKVSKRFKVEDKLQDVDIATKGNFEHFMLKEIHEQPNLISRLLKFYTSDEGKSGLETFAGKKYPHVHMIGCGTAWHAGLVTKNYFEQIAKQRTTVDLASEFRYRDPIVEKDELSIFISQSGETADTLACAEMLVEKKIPTLSIVNVKGSTLYRVCQNNLLIKADQEIGVASTKAFTLQALTGYFLANYLAGNSMTDKVRNEVSALEMRIAELLEKTQLIEDIAEEIYNKKGFIFTGRGIYFPIALEGALKLKEIAYVHAEGYAAGELKHGPIALIDHEIVNIALVGPELMDKTISNAEEVKARRGIVLILGEEKESAHLREISDYFIPLNFQGLGHLKPLYMNVALQLLAYYIAKLKGTDIDKPRNLAKSVTVE